MSLVDREARDRIANDFETTFVVEAAAGTGKTTALVERIVGLIRTGRARAESILATTFTSRAAGEIVLRVRGALEAARARATDADRTRLEQGIRELERMRIGTLHEVAFALLREFPLEAGLDPDLQGLAEEEQTAVIVEVVDRWLADHDEGLPPSVVAMSDAASRRDVLKHALLRRLENRDLTAPWRQPPGLDAARRSLVAHIDALRPLVEALPTLAALTTGLDQARVDDGSLDAFLGSLDERAFTLPKGSRKPEALRALEEDSKSFVRLFRQSLAVAARDELEALVVRYEARLRSLGRIDFQEMVVRFASLLRSHRAVRAELQARFAAILVDEVQDTDPLQFDIVRLLACRDPEVGDPALASLVPGKLFVVGDPKQAIYGFRRADLASYYALRSSLLAQGAAILQLTTSFRSQPRLQSAINQAFAGMPDYVPLAPHRADGPFRSLHRIRIEAPHDSDVAASLPDAIAGFLRGALGCLTVDEAGLEVPLRPEHVAIVVRARTSSRVPLLDRLVQSLRREGIPVALPDQLRALDHEVLLGCINLLESIESPEDPLVVTSVLLGPFVAATDAELLAHLASHSRVRALSPMAFLDQREAEGPIPRTLAWLGKLHLERHRRPPATSLALALDALDAFGKVALLQQDEGLAKLEALLEWLRERPARRSLRELVDELREHLDANTPITLPWVDDRSRGVRILTVHAAKGLEFPMVILGDPTSAWVAKDGLLDRSKGLHLHAIGKLEPHELIARRDEVERRGREELERVAYVAATRARDHLVLVTGSKNSWYAALTRVPPDERPLPDLLDATEAASPDRRRMEPSPNDLERDQQRRTRLAQRRGLAEAGARDRMPFYDLARDPLVLGEEQGEVLAIQGPRLDLSSLLALRDLLALGALRVDERSLASLVRHGDVPPDTFETVRQALAVLREHVPMQGSWEGDLWILQPTFLGPTGEGPLPLLLEGPDGWLAVDACLAEDQAAATIALGLRVTALAVDRGIPVRGVLLIGS